MAGPRDVPMASGDPSPCWPLPDAPRRVTADFGDFRKGEKGRRDRHHVGEDIPAPRGAVVRAMEPGVVVGTQAFRRPNAYAMMVRGDSGLSILYGAVEPDSWSEFGVSVGSRVGRCQPIARVGMYPRGSTMLHLETYTGNPKRNLRWYQGELPPPQIRNPTTYLRLAAATLDTLAPEVPTPAPPFPLPEPVARAPRPTPPIPTRRAPTPPRAPPRAPRLYRAPTVPTAAPVTAPRAPAPAGPVIGLLALIAAGLAVGYLFES